MAITVIGVDCATEARKVGMALARFDGKKTSIQEVVLGTPTRPPIDVLHAWMKMRPGPALLALDAPLGWPGPLAKALAVPPALDSTESARKEGWIWVKRPNGSRPEPG